MSAYTHPVSRAIPEALRHLAWFVVVCAVAFLVPYLAVSVLDLQHDVFYLVYFAVTIALACELCPGRAGRCGRDLPLSVAVEPRPRRCARRRSSSSMSSTPRMRRHGRTVPISSLNCFGVASATALIDTLLLTVFPCFVAYRLLHGRVDGLKRQAPVHGADAAARDHRHGDLPPGLPPVSPGRPQSPRDREHPDLDPDASPPQTRSARSSRTFRSTSPP